MNATQSYSIVIVGAGFAGLGMAIQLKRAGIDDFVILERAGRVGGTWRDNTYPGCGCDVESHLYSYSFAPNPNWSRMWSGQEEILKYLEDCVTRFEITPHLRLSQTLLSADWVESTARWRLQTTAGEYTTQSFISATGALSEPLVPSIPGLSTFKGNTFHSARWDHTYDLKGKTVAVIGTGASAIQFVPEIQKQVEKLYLFQRTAAWVIPARNTAISPKQHARYAKFPLLQKLWRLRIYLFRELLGFCFRHCFLQKKMQSFGESYLRRKVKDEGLRKKLTPTFAIGCKRILISKVYYPAVQQPNVEVITDRIESVGADHIRTQDGKTRKIDAVILGTGFELRDIHGAKLTRGRSGQTLADFWKGSPSAYLGTSVNGFPNFFLLFGPNTALGHTSVLLMLESQITHVLEAIQYQRSRGVRTLEPRAEIQSNFVSQVDRQMQRTVWASGCTSWYIDSTGRNSAIWPSSVGAFRKRVSKFSPSEYVFTETGATQ